MPEPRPSPAPTRQVDLSRLTIAEDLSGRLDALVERTGAPGTWHRRRALEQYLDRCEAEE